MQNSYFFSFKRKCKADGYHAVCAQLCRSFLLPVCSTDGKEQAVQCKVPTNKKARDLTTPRKYSRSSNPPSPDSFDVIVSGSRSISRFCPS